MTVSVHTHTATWRKVQEQNEHVTKTFMIVYDLPGEQHILCNGMYEYQVDWLLRVLERVEDTNIEPFPECKSKGV